MGKRKKGKYTHENFRKEMAKRGVKVVRGRTSGATITFISRKKNARDQSDNRNE